MSMRLDSWRAELAKLAETVSWKRVCWDLGEWKWFDLIETYIYASVQT